MAIGQALHDDLVDTMPHDNADKFSKANNDKGSVGKMAYHGRGGNLSIRTRPQSDANRPVIGTAGRFQRARGRKRK